MRRLWIPAVLLALVLGGAAPPPDAPALVDGGTGPIPATIAQEIWQIELFRLPTTTLLPLLAHPDDAVRARAARALGRLRDDDAARPLAPLLRDPSANVRREAAFALGMTPGGSGALLEAWRAETDATVRAALGGALGRQGGGEAVDALIEALDGPWALPAADALGRLAMRRVAAARDDRAVGALLDLVDLELRFEARRRAAWAIGRMGLTSASDELLRRMREHIEHEGDAAVRTALLRAWAPLATDAARADVLAGTARDPDIGVRIATARAIVRNPSPALAPLLRSLLADAVRDVRVEAAPAVPLVAKSDAAALLSSAWLSRDPVERAAAVTAMIAAGVLPLPATDLLGPDQPMGVRVAALAGVGDRKRLLNLALRAPEPPIRSGATTALLAADTTVDELLALVRGPDEAIAQAAAEAIQERPAGAAEPALIEVLRRVDVRVETGEAVVRALAAVYASGQVARPSPEVAAIVAPWLTRPRLRDDAARLAALLKVEPPKVVHPRRKIPPLEEALSIRGARIYTSAGEIRVRFFPEEAPYTVWNFASLAESGAFDDITFHRVVPAFVIQTGDRRGDGWGGPGWEIPDEITPREYRAGTFGMALSGPDTGGSQWFVTLDDQPHLDAGYTAFGEVTHGMRVARAIGLGATVARIVIERERPTP